MGSTSGTKKVTTSARPNGEIGKGLLLGVCCCADDVYVCDRFSISHTALRHVIRHEKVLNSFQVDFRLGNVVVLEADRTARGGGGHGAAEGRRTAGGSGHRGGGRCDGRRWQPDHRCRRRCRGLELERHVRVHRDELLLLDVGEPGVLKEERGKWVYVKLCFIK